MNKEEAAQILSVELNAFRAKGFAELAELIADSPLVVERQGASGAAYQIEVEVFWDDPKKLNEDLRVMAGIDDGRLLSAFSPLTDSFIVRPDGSFVGE
jgi:hypothetical protein